MVPNAKPLPKKLETILRIFYRRGGGPLEAQEICRILVEKGVPNITLNKIYQRLDALEAKRHLVRISPGLYCLPRLAPRPIDLKQFMYAEIKSAAPHGMTVRGLIKSLREKHHKNIVARAAEELLRELYAEKLVTLDLDGKTWRLALNPSDGRS